MTPRPLIKWKSFWLGILVLVFLGWAWVRSNAREEYVEWVTATTGTIAVQHQGQVWFYRGGVPALFSEGFRFGRHETFFEGQWFPTALKCEAGEGYINIWLAHWFIVLLFLVPWGGFLAWRVRKQRKLAFS